MTVQKLLLLVWAFPSLCAPSLVEQFKQTGYAEVRMTKHDAATFDALYVSFDTLVEFLQKNPAWARKLYTAKERFIRSKDRNYYSTDFFGFYDESERAGRNQVSFYYSTHFHEYIYAHYPEFKTVPAISDFLETCFSMQTPYGDLFAHVAADAGLETIFSSQYGHPPILLKVIKYLPEYAPTRPHYDGTAFSLFLDSTDNQSLLLSPYKSSFTTDDFHAPPRENCMLLIPGTFLTEFSLYPTPHIVTYSGKVRYATIAFAMRPHYIPQKIAYSSLPDFNHYMMLKK